MTDCRVASCAPMLLAVCSTPLVCRQDSTLNFVLQQITKGESNVCTAAAHLLPSWYKHPLKLFCNLIPLIL